MEKQDRSHDVETDAERARLRALVSRLNDADLSRPMPAGWTIAAVLPHIGFWDARAIYWLAKWGRGVPPSAYAPEDTGAGEVAAKPPSVQLPPREWGERALPLGAEGDRTGQGRAEP